MNITLEQGVRVFDVNTKTCARNSNQQRWNSEPKGDETMGRIDPELLGGWQNWAGGNRVNTLSLARVMCEASLFPDKRRVEGESCLDEDLR